MLSLDIGNNYDELCLCYCIVRNIPKSNITKMHLMCKKMVRDLQHEELRKKNVSYVYVCQVLLKEIYDRYDHQEKVHKSNNITTNELFSTTETVELQAQIDDNEIIEISSHDFEEESVDNLETSIVEVNKNSSETNAKEKEIDAVKRRKSKFEAFEEKLKKESNCVAQYLAYHDLAK